MDTDSISQAELETLLRRHTTKLRASIRGLTALLRRRHGSEIPGELLDDLEARLLAETERGIDQMSTAIREGL